MLFGKHNPEGKLPVSFDRSWEENPSAPYYYPIKGADTSLHVIEEGRPPVDYVIPHVKYEDKLMVGYRYWTTTGKHPLFPFGFGLSYTTFSFANLQVPATAASGSTVTVSFDVTNTGSVAGAEVAQLYVSDPSAKVSRPERELKGFEKVRLAPGETQARDSQPGCPRLQLLGRGGPQVDHRSRQICDPRRRLQRKHAAQRGVDAEVAKQQIHSREASRNARPFCFLMDVWLHYRIISGRALLADSSAKAADRKDTLKSTEHPCTTGSTRAAAFRKAL